MKIFKRFFDFILFGNIYVSLGIVCLIQSTIIQLQLKDYLLFYTLLSFFAGIFIYNLQRFFYKPQQNISLHSVRREWIFRNQTTIKTLTLIGFTGVFTTFFFNDYKIIFYLSPLFALSIFYFLPTIKLRKSPVFKLITLVMVWTFATAVIPILLNKENIFNAQNLLHIASRLCFMLAICIPFDIRDLKIDLADKISTIPQVIGEKKTRWLALAFIFIHVFLIVLEYNFNSINYKTFIELLLAGTISTVLISFSSSKQNEYFYVVIMDGTMILQYLALTLN